MSDHIAIEVLADAAAGVLDDEQTHRVEAHVDACLDCRADWDALDGVSVLLGELPTPTMPAEVADRLSAALAAEEARATESGAELAAGSAAGSAVGSPSENVSRTVADDRPTNTPRPGSLGGEAHQWHTLGAFGADLSRPRRSRFIVGALVASAAAAVVGLGGYVLSASTGLNEPASAPAVVSTSQLGAQAHDLLRRADLTPHRFSAAWRCARQVTDGRITAITNAVVDGRPALLVYTRTESGEEVTVVTGCDLDQPSAGPSTTLPR